MTTRRAQLSSANRRRYIHGQSHPNPPFPESAMSRRRIAASFVALTVVLCATAAWSYFKLAVTGETMAETATKFLDTLSTDQRAKAALKFDDKQRVDWHFIPKPDGAREGIKVRDMNEEQRKAAHALLKAALSEAGYSKA